MLSTRSVRMNLARPFKGNNILDDILLPFQGRGPRAGNPRGVEGREGPIARARRVATSETGANSIVATRRKQANNLIPALKRRAKFIPTLRVEDT
jgi:hypothetical protein